MSSDIEEFQRDQAKIGQEATDQENDAAYRMLSRLQKDRTKIQSGVIQCTNELEALNKHKLIVSNEKVRQKILTSATSQTPSVLLM
jgi:hypothetical protein